MKRFLLLAILSLALLVFLCGCTTSDSHGENGKESGESESAEGGNADSSGGSSSDGLDYDDPTASDILWSDDLKPIT